MKMHIERFGKRLALELPVEWVDQFRLHEGDEIDADLIESALRARLEEQDERRRRAIDEMRSRARPLPADWKFDREEANAR